MGRSSSSTQHLSLWERRSRCPPSLQGGASPSRSHLEPGRGSGAREKRKLQQEPPPPAREAPAGSQRWRSDGRGRVSAAGPRGSRAGGSAQGRGAQGRAGGCRHSLSFIYIYVYVYLISFEFQLWELEGRACGGGSPGRRCRCRAAPEAEPCPPCPAQAPPAPELLRLPQQRPSLCCADPTRPRQPRSCSGSLSLSPSLGCAAPAAGVPSRPLRCRPG